MDRVGTNSCFGQMIIIQSDSFNQGNAGDGATSGLPFEAQYTPSEEEALACLRQQQRQLVDKSELLQ